MARGKRRKDWHPADVLAALKKAGWTLRRVGEVAEYANPRSAYHVLTTPMPRVEAVIGRVLKVAPDRIWPSRYDATGQPLGKRRVGRIVAVKTHSGNAGGEA